MPLISKFTNYSPIYNNDYYYNAESPFPKKQQKKNPESKRNKNEFDGQIDREVTGARQKKLKKSTSKDKDRGKPQMPQELRKSNEVKTAIGSPEKEPAPAKSKNKNVKNTKRQRKNQSCSDRLFALAMPKRSTIIQNYQYYQHVLPPKSIEKFRELLNTYSGDVYPNSCPEYGALN